MAAAIIWQTNHYLPLYVSYFELAPGIQYDGFKDRYRPDEICVLAPRTKEGSHRFACSIWFRHFEDPQPSIIFYIKAETYERDAVLYRAFVEQRYGSSVLKRIQFCEAAIEPTCDDECSCAPLIAIAYAFYMSVHKIPRETPLFPNTDAFNCDLRLKMANTLINDVNVNDFRNLKKIL